VKNEGSKAQAAEHPLAEGFRCGANSIGLSRLLLRELDDESGI